MPNEVVVGEVHHNEQMKKSFNIWSAVGLMASAQATPMAMGGYLSLIVGVGGPPVFIYSYFIGCTFSFLLCLSLAEIAAVYPSASGQIYWTAVFSNNKHARWLSYYTGWMLCSGWFLWVGGTNLLAAQILSAIVTAFYPSFSASSWQIYLLVAAFTLVNWILNVPLFNFYPHFSKAMLYWFNLGALFIFVSLLARAHPKQSAHDVFVSMINATGWDSNVVVFFIGLVPGVGFVSGFDCVTHMADEVPDPHRVVPLVMVGASAISFLAGLPMLFTYTFCNTKPQNLLTPIGNNPIVQLYLDAYDSKALTVTATAILLVGEIAAAAACLCAAGRSWWAFAEHQGTPFPKFFGRVNKRYSIPVNAITFLAVLTVLISAICIGSTTALNAILGGGLLCVYISYFSPIILMLKARSTLPKTRYFNLGRFGIVANILGLAWMLWMFVWMCFPLYLPVTANNMNYTSAVIGTVTAISALSWCVYSKSRFIIPIQVYQGLVRENAVQAMGNMTDAKGTTLHQYAKKSNFVPM